MFSSAVTSLVLAAAAATHAICSEACPSIISSHCSTSGGTDIYSPLEAYGIGSYFDPDEIIANGTSGNSLSLRHLIRSEDADDDDPSNSDSAPPYFIDCFEATHGSPCTLHVPLGSNPSISNTCFFCSATCRIELFNDLAGYSVAVGSAFAFARQEFIWTVCLSLALLLCCVVVDFKKKRASASGFVSKLLVPLNDVVSATFNICWLAKTSPSMACVVFLLPKATASNVGSALAETEERSFFDASRVNSNRHLQHRSTIRGSSAATLSKMTQGQLMIDQSLDDFRSLISIEDTKFLRSLAGDDATDLSEEDMHRIHQDIVLDLGLVEGYESLNTLVRDEIRPMVQELTKFTQSRHLENSFDFHKKAGHDSSPPYGRQESSPNQSSSKTQHNAYFSKSKPGRDAFYSFPGASDIQSLLNDPQRLDHFVEKMFLRDGTKGGGLSSIFSTAPRHHRHRIHAKSDETRRRLLESKSTCDARCDQDDPEERKECNCRDLFHCVKQLKDTDFAGIFSRGLVDKETGSIRVEEEDIDDGRLWKQGSGVLDDDGNPRKRANTVLDDIFDANNLLEKINRIRGLTLPVDKGPEMIQNCEALLDEFHVPCRDWQDGCSTSDGRSYRMTIDEICDAIDSSDLITFSSMSTAFDEETTAEASCYVGVQPDDNTLLQAAVEGAKIVFNGDLSFESEVSGHTISQEVLNGAQDFYDSFVSEINLEFIFQCLGNNLCTLFSTEITAKETFGVVGSVEGYTKATFVIKGREFITRVEDFENNVLQTISTFVAELPSEQRYRNAIVTAMQDQFNGIPNIVEPCLATECRLDTKVGLQSCQEMVDCADRIYEAGKSIPDSENIPNPYPFTTSNKQGNNAVKKVKNAAWNLNLALGKTAVASSTQDCTSYNVCYNPYFVIDGKKDTSWASKRGEEIAWLTVDLGEMYNIKEVQIDWLAAPGRFEVQISNSNGVDTDEWDTVVERSPTTPRGRSIDNLVKMGRYIRIICIEFFDFTAYVGGGGSGGTPVDFYYGISEVKVILDPVPANLPSKSKWDKMSWPTKWNLSKDPQHGWEVFSPGTEESNALAHIADDESDFFSTDITFSTTFSGKLTEPFIHSVPIEKPKICSLDTREDSRCDDARSVLFGASASVGQICSIAEAVRPQDPVVASAPDNMPGTCCLDNIKTLKNFGDRYSCTGKEKCSRFAPYTLGFSKDACDQVGGTWCRRPCTVLKQCIENKPKRNKCRVAARFEITDDHFNLTNSGNECDNENDSIFLTVTCEDLAQPDRKCRISSDYSKSGRVLIEEFDQSEPDTSNLKNLSGVFESAYNQSNTTISVTMDSSLPAACFEKIFKFTYKVTFHKSAEPDNSKVITHFIRGHAGIQTDLYHNLGDDPQMIYGDGPLTITSAEAMRICPNDKLHESLIVLEFEDSDFNEAFDEYSSDLVIDEPNEEAQCQQVRDILGFDLDYVDDFEICREFHDVKCDFANNEEGPSAMGREATSRPKGGKISDFRGFEFKASKFDGFEFEASEFITFEFNGFEPSPGLTFDAVQGVALEEKGVHHLSDSEMKAVRRFTKAVQRAQVIAKALKKKIKGFMEKCPFPLLVVNGYGTDIKCKFHEKTVYVFYIVAFQVVVALTLWALYYDHYYSEVAAVKDEDHWRIYYWTEAAYKNMNILNTALHSNLNIINSNINNQHLEVRNALENQHSTMMELLSSQHSEIGTQLTDQHNSIGNQLTEQHTSIGEQLTEQHNSVGRQLTGQHNSIGAQLTEHHRTLQGNILRLAYAFGGRMSNAVLNPMLEFEGPSPYDILVEILAHLNGTDTGIMQNLTARSQSEAHGESNHTSIELKLEDLTADILRNCSTETTQVEVHVTSKTAELEAHIDANTVEILANCSAEASQIEKQIDFATAEVSRNCTAESSKMEARIDSKVAETQNHITDTTMAIRNNITRELSRMESKLSNAQTAMADKLSGLEIEAKCVNSPGGESESSNSAQRKSVSAAFMVYTKFHGEPMEVKVEFVDVVFQRKDGTVQSQPASAVTTTPLPAGSGRQHVRISIETSKGAIQNMNNVLIVDIHVVDSEGRTNRASIVPCGPPYGK